MRATPQHCKSAPRAMRGMSILRAVLAAASMVAPAPCLAQSAMNITVLRGLSPISVLPQTAAGRAALAANLKITGAIQTGSLSQPTLLPFPDQERQAVKDAFITARNAAEFADGLGSTLGALYQAKAHYTDAKTYTDMFPSVMTLLAYSAETTFLDANSAKYFFGNTTTNGKAPVSAAALAIMAGIGGVSDVYGKAYGLPAGAVGADPFGDSRPFQTEPSLKLINGPDYFGKPASNVMYLRGPAETLTDSPAFPSGHSSYGYTEALLLGILVPARYQQEITRAAEFGNDRIILGAHYAMDVLSGRTVALYDLAHLLANDPRYAGQPKKRSAVISDYQTAVKTARADLVAFLQSGCGATVAACAAKDSSRFKNPSANKAFYESTQTYGLPVVYPDIAAKTEDVGRIAPEAGYLLTAAFPALSLAAADAVLTQTEGPGGGFLDNGSAFGVYSRLNLYDAVTKAMAMASAITVPR